MPNITNQKTLREYCNLSKCEVWKAIVALEEKGADEKGDKERTTLRRFCAGTCMAYQYSKFLDGNNFEVRRRKGYTQYHG